MIISPQSLILVLFVSYLFGLLSGGIISLAFAMRVAKRAEGSGYDR